MIARTGIRLGVVFGVMLLGLFLWWWSRPPKTIEPAGPNPFVEKVTITPIAADAVPFGETITIPSTTGVYARVDLQRFDEIPTTFGEREVSPPHRWPLTLAIYRPGRPTGPESYEFACHVPGHFVERPTRDEIGHVPPPWVPNAGTTRLRTTARGFSGPPNLPSKPPDQNVYWTFLLGTDQEDPAGEYVYEVRLYPTARWVSKIRAEFGSPIVLKRGLLIASDG